MKTPNNLAEFLSYIEGLHPKPIDLGLERVAEVATRLQCQNFSCPVVTIAGTNGKGSTVAALAHIARENDLNTATYTSPHLHCFNERIQVNGQQITDEKLLEVLQVVERARGEITLTYFEFTTLAALYYFQQQKLDLIILEVGMGGRLDAVNIVDPDISIITNIALDHTQWLGDSLDAIAREKAGIMHANKPVIIGQPQPALQEVAKKVGAQLHFAVESGVKTHLHPNSLACAIKAAELLKLNINLQSLQNLTLKGRYEKRVIDGRLHIFDVAHNADAMQNLAERVQTEPHQNLHIVLGMLNDKDIEAAVQPLHALQPHYYCVSIAGERGLHAEDLARRINYVGKVSCFDDIKSARNAAQAAANESDAVLVTGSFYMYDSFCRTF
jgi:dihydrofolate synthase/folylpolyglutamate synthase